LTLLGEDIACGKRAIRKIGERGWQALLAALAWDFVVD
jgi:hypothetical protein